MRDSPQPLAPSFAVIVAATLGMGRVTWNVLEPGAAGTHPRLVAMCVYVLLRAHLQTGRTYIYPSKVLAPPKADDKTGSVPFEFRQLVFGDNVGT